MAETVEFSSNGTTASGYLVKPATGSGPGVLVIQEWWGLDPDIKEWANRLGAAGFVALAPDLFHGEIAHHDEMEMQYVISPIIQACDAISGARPGARREIMQQYLRSFELHRRTSALRPISWYRRLPAWLPSRSAFFPVSDWRSQWM